MAWGERFITRTDRSASLRAACGQIGSRNSGGNQVRRSWLRLFWTGAVVAGAIGGYLVSTGFSARLLHQEIETQLGRILAGPVKIAEVDLQLSEGLLLEARGVEAYPSQADDGVPVLRARRVLAWIDLLALLVGRLELSTLVLEGPHLHIERDADGALVGLPLPPLEMPDLEGGKLSVSERFARELTSLDPAATAFAAEFQVADRVEIQDGTLSWIDHSRPVREGAPQSFRLELLSGVAERDWLSDAIALESTAVFIDGQHAPFPIALAVHRDEGHTFDWKLSFSQIPLEAAETPLSFVEQIDGLSGTLDADLHLTRTPTGETRLAFEGRIDDATIGLRKSRSVIEHERVELRAEIAINEQRLSLADGRLAGQRIGIEFQGTTERPVRPASPTQIDSRMVGVQFEDLRELARSLEAESETALALSRLTRRVESGRIQHIQAAGTAPLSEWGDLLTGRSRELPDGFLLGGSFDQISVGTGPDDRIEELSGQVEWIEDRISLREATAIFRGRPLPTINATIDGVSHLARSPDTALQIATTAPPTPGLGPLRQIIRPRDPDALPPVKALGLAIDHLDHPIFRWPLKDVRVIVEPLRRGVQLNIREGFWGGASVEGELVWFNDPMAPTVSATLVLGPGPNPIESAAATPPVDRGSESPSTRWGAGRFEVEFRPRPRLPYQRASGFFQLEGAELAGRDITIELEPKGQTALRAAIELSDPDSIGLDFSFALTEGRLGKLGPMMALPPALATGRIQATGSLAGRVKPNTSFVAELDGRIRAEASNGRIKTNIPLLLRLAKATEGYSPFANEDELRYESMTGTIDFEQGRLSVADFEIEGPLRVFAKAEIDTNQRPGDIRAVIGIFLFRRPNQILENLPIVRFFLPGSERGLVGAYFEVAGAIDEPKVAPLPLATMASAVPSAIKAPFKVLRFLFDRGDNDS